MIARVIVVLAWMLSGPVVAGQISVIIDADPPTTTEGVTVEVRASDAVLPQDGNQRFQYQWPKTDLTMPLQIRTAEAPDGHVNFTMRFDLPFYDAPDVIALAAPIIPRKFSGSHIANLEALNSSLFNPRAGVDLIRIHQRALQAMITARAFMSSVPREANIDDGRIAFQLAKATARLMRERYYVPTAANEDAIGFIAALLADPDDAGRVFPNAKERNDLIAVLALIEATPSALRTEMVNKIDPLIFDIDTEKAAVACSRAEAMSSVYRSLASSEVSELRSELRNLEGVAVCANRSLDWAIGGTRPSDADQRLAKAELILAMVRDRIENYDDNVQPSEDTTETRRRVGSRLSELEMKFAALS